MVFLHSMAENLLWARRAKAGGRYEAGASQLTAALPVTSVPTQEIKLGGRCLLGVWHWPWHSLLTLRRSLAAA